MRVIGELSEVAAGPGGDNILHDKIEIGKVDDEGAGDDVRCEQWKTR